jgi:hypothetical protein
MWERAGSGRRSDDSGGSVNIDVECYAVIVGTPPGAGSLPQVCALTDRHWGLPPLGRKAAPKPAITFFRHIAFAGITTATQPSGAVRRSDKPPRHKTA